MFKVSFSLILMLTLLISCGGGSDKGILDDIFGKSTKKKEIPFSSCEIDTKSLAEILKRNIKTELLCLEQNLDTFIKAVETDRPGSLSYKTLSEFARQVLNVDEGTINALGAFFDLSSLLLGDDEGYIKQENIKPLISLLIEKNRIFVEGSIYKYFTATEVVSFAEHNRRKSQVYNSFKELGNLFNSNAIENNRSVDLLKFLLRFESIGNDHIIENAKNLLFLKKAILGGEPGVLTGTELKRAATLFPEFSKVIFDFVNIPDTGENSYEDEELLKLYREDVRTAKRYFFYSNQPNEVIFTFDDIKQFVNRFFPDMAEFFKYKNSILEAKEILFRTNKEEFIAEEINILLDDILYKNFDRGVYFYKYFNENQLKLMLKVPMEEKLELSDDADKNKEVEYMFHFNRIVKNYQFFIGDKSLPTFNYDYNRNARGIFEVSFFEDLVQRFFKKLGSPNPQALYNYSMTLEELEATMIRFTEVFEGEGWITDGRTASTAETITLMTSLFFKQSNGDEFIEVPEFGEFIVSMLSALKISTEAYENIHKFCEVSKYGTYSGQCFRDNFKEILKLEVKGQTLGSYMPELTRYLNKLPKRDLDTYLKRTATFSRTCPYFNNGEERPMNNGDGLVTIAGLLAVEQSVLRFDKDRPTPGSVNFEKEDGVLTPEELEGAFEVYGPAVGALAPDFMGPKQIKRLYQYILKHQKVPADLKSLPTWKEKFKAAKDGLHLLSFIYAPWPVMTEKKRQSDATRMTFAAVLEIIAENSPATKAMFEEDPMICEKMRHPEE